MSSVHTVNAPSYGDRRGDGARRDRDDDDERGRRSRNNAKPTDKMSAADFGPDGYLRRMVLLLLERANMGNLPSGCLLTGSGNAKPLVERITTIRRWANGLNTINGNILEYEFSELAVAFVHTVRAISSGGCFDQLVSLLVEHLTELAVEDYQERH